MFAFSGVIGSGLCIFSKHPIMETQGFPYTVNGYAHKIHHGDWYGRKAVGLAKLLMRDIRVNVYITHVSVCISVFVCLCLYARMCVCVRVRV